MSRKPIERSKSDYYHLTARSNNKEFWYLSTLEVWDIFCDELRTLKSKFNLNIAAFVLMDNHFHLLMRSPEEDIDKVMYFFMKNTTLEMQSRSNRINKIFGGRYKGSIIKSYSYMVNVYKYIYRNPVAANITDKSEFYPYSTLYYKHIKKSLAPFRVEEIFPLHAFDEFEDLDELKWINQSFNEEESESIKCGLRKTIFSYKKDNGTGKEIIPIVRAPKKKTQEELWDDMFPENKPTLLISL